MIDPAIHAFSLLLALACTLPAEELNRFYFYQAQELKKFFFYDEQSKQFECAKAHPDVFCCAERGMAMVFPLSPERSKARVIEIMPAFFPPSNARLDQSFADYIEFMTETLRQWDMKQKGEIRGPGGMMIDGQPRNVYFTITDLRIKKWRGQKWLIDIERHGKAEMYVSLEQGDVTIEYRRTMDDGSFTESSYSYRANAQCPRVIVLDPSHASKE